MYAAAVQDLIDELGRLPGIGPKSAQRIAFYLLKLSADDALRLARAISVVKERVSWCHLCFNIAEGGIAGSAECDICRDDRRDSAVLCVVEEPRDVVAVEKTREYHGRYHVLQGAISPIDGIGPDKLRVRELLARLDTGDVKEVILCTNPNIEGDATALYLASLLKLLPVKVTRIASGLPVGGDLEYADELTLGRALEGRRELIRWSEVAICHINAPDALVRSEEERFAELLKFTEHMNVLWEDRAKRPPEFDIISILAHSDLTNKMSLRERMGILILFLVGGNDTTRNSMSGGVWGLSQYPDERRKVRENPGLIPGLISEIIRWQTPVIHMRRTALDDAEIGGKPIKKGDKVVIWYISGNRDEEAIENPNALVADRPRPREHLSFGFGIHRCLGNRLAELQLRILWEEILKRNIEIEVMDNPKYLRSNLIHGIRELPVQIH